MSTKGAAQTKTRKHGEQRTQYEYRNCNWIILLRLRAYFRLLTPEYTTSCRRHHHHHHQSLQTERSEWEPTAQKTAHCHFTQLSLRWLLWHCDSCLSWSDNHPCAPCHVCGVNTSAPARETYVARPTRRSCLFELLICRHPSKRSTSNGAVDWLYEGNFFYLFQIFTCKWISIGVTEVAVKVAKPAVTVHVSVVVIVVVEQIVEVEDGAVESVATSTLPSYTMSKQTRLENREWQGTSLAVDHTGRTSAPKRQQRNHRQTILAGVFAQDTRNTKGFVRSACASNCVVLQETDYAVPEYRWRTTSLHPPPRKTVCCGKFWQMRSKSHRNVTQNCVASFVLAR